MSLPLPDVPVLPEPVTPIGPDEAPDQVDTSVRPEDGEQDVDQDPDFEEADSDEPEDVADPSVDEVA